VRVDDPRNLPIHSSANLYRARSVVLIGGMSETVAGGKTNYSIQELLPHAL
jgi:hypothetical protein